MVFVGISSNSATRLDPYLVGLSTGNLTGRIAVEIYNRDLDAEMYCGFSGATTSNGRIVEPRASWSLSVGSNIQLFCISQATSTVFDGCNLTQLK